jgi:hypothetical protein
MPLKLKMFWGRLRGDNHRRLLVDAPSGPDGRLLMAADSLAWSYAARKAKGPMIQGHKHRKCNNCLTWAMRWRSRLLKTVKSALLRPWQMTIC